MYQVVVDEAILSEIVQRLVEAIHPDKIILFGSRARGDTHAQSDVDLLIIKASQESAYRRVGDLYVVLYGIGVPIDVLWYTPEEIEEWSGVRSHVTTRALREGRVLYERQH
jgi:predicted nucleotidyltransferase